MTTFRSSALTLIFALAFAGTATAQPKADADRQCSNIDPFVERACVDRRIAEKEKRLEHLYVQALQSVRNDAQRYGRNDNRSDPKYLEQSQTAWRRFVDADCTVRAAFGGGSNSAISDRETECWESALDQRLEFLGELANGSYGAG
jgi:uncharacterized protein YecT (DUF1311 family)